MSQQTSNPDAVIPDGIEFVGIWHGGANYARGDYADSLELFATLESARDALQDRATMGHSFSQRFTYADGRTDDTLTPCADEGATLELWRVFPGWPVADVVEILERGDMERAHMLKLDSDVPEGNVWLLFLADDDEDAHAEANVYADDNGGARVDWSLTAVGLVKSVTFANYADASAWLMEQGYADFSS